MHDYLQWIHVLHRLNTFFFFDLHSIPLSLELWNYYKNKLAMGSKHSDAILIESYEQHFMTAIFSVAITSRCNNNTECRINNNNSFKFHVCAACIVYSFSSKLPHNWFYMRILDLLYRLRWFHQFRYYQVHLHILSIQFENGRLILLHFTCPFITHVEPWARSHFMC